MDVFVLQCGLGAIEVKSFPVANPGLKMDAEQVREPEDPALWPCVSAWIVSGRTSESFSTR
jgi:hypothetical protein